MRDRQESAEAIVVKTPVETWEERRAEEPRESNRPTVLLLKGRVGGRNNQGIATAAVSLIGSCEHAGGFLQSAQCYVHQVFAVAKGGAR